MICSSSNWENNDLQPPTSLLDRRLDARCEDTIDFDSQDEDECEDLFAGVWSPILAMKRRQGKSFRKSRAATSAEIDTRRR